MNEGVVLGIWPTNTKINLKLGEKLIIKANSLFDFSKVLNINVNAVSRVELGNILYGRVLNLNGG